MKNKSKLLFLAILTAFALWRTQSHDDAMTLVTAGMVTLCLFFLRGMCGKIGNKKRAFGLFFYGDRRLLPGSLLQEIWLFWRMPKKIPAI